MKRSESSRHDAVGRGGGGFFGFVGRNAVDVITEVGAAGIVLGRSALALRHLPRSLRLVLDQMRRIGVESLPLVIFTSVFTGAVAAVQAAYQLKDYVPKIYLGTAIYKAIVIELGPVLTALVVGGRVAASIAAELGTMRVTEQIDAMEAMAIDPSRYLTMPRIAAALIMLPALTVFADTLAIFGGFVVSSVSLDVSAKTFVDGMQFMFYPGDILGGLVKACFFGGIIALMGCTSGLRAAGGAVGVGQAATRAVVSCCMLILVMDYVLTTVLYRVLFGG